MKQYSYPKQEIKILLLENIHPVAKEILQREGFSVETHKEAWTEEEVIAKASDFHVVGIRSKTHLNGEFFKKSKRLLTVGCFCIGTNQVDLGSAKKSGTVVFNAPFSNTRSVAELIIAEIVMLARKIGDKNIKAHKGVWDKSANGCYEIRGKSLGIVGYGHIGSQVSILAESFGMRVIYYDIVTKMPLGNSKQVSNLDELLSQSDFVTLHVPETAQTKNMMAADQLHKMKKSSFLLNASRGTVVDIEDLKSVLDSGHLAGAAVDVFPVEPESNKQKFISPLQETSNVILTPHIGGSTEEAQENIGIEVATSISKYINGGSTTGSVNFPNVDLPVQQNAHRILNVHKNVPGVLKSINSILSDLGANIQGQYLSTDPDIGYLIVDLDVAVSDKAKDEISRLSSNIKTRILY